MPRTLTLQHCPSPSLMDPLLPSLGPHLTAHSTDIILLFPHSRGPPCHATITPFYFPHLLCQSFICIHVYFPQSPVVNALKGRALAALFEPPGLGQYPTQILHQYWRMPK
ncbi:unnamed protein product [Rangifer tarandus platyrhynchus]|uniref:Uncharacterized protein n=2 Tax=Rangifer tarandus platyrhynchus TaxID=3082113 RepID=A0ABN8ZE03_RANTA|nr:unnamed protein product [Rangifer tarandus platyrhynchus]